MTASQSGFVQSAVLVGMAVVAIAVAAFAIAGRESTTSTSAEHNRMAALLVIKQGNEVKDAALRAIYDGTTLTNSLSELVSGGYMTVMPTPSSDAGTGVAYIKPADRRLGTLGTTLGNDTYLALKGVNDDVCKRINAILYGENEIPDVGQAIASPVNAAVVLVSGVWLQRTEGCVEDTFLDPGNNIYYKVVRVQ